MTDKSKSNLLAIRLTGSGFLVQYKYIPKGGTHIMPSNNNLRDYRKKMKMLQKELSKISGVSQVTISFIENGLSEPMELTKQRLAEALGVDLQTLFPRSR